MKKLTLLLLVCVVLPMQHAATAQQTGFLAARQRLVLSLA